MLVAHRRAGKTVAAVNDLVEKASYNTRENPRYAYIAPLLRQAKDIAWQYLKDAAAPYNPKINESQLYVELSALPNSPRITLYGADNPDSFRGMYFDGVVLDEFGNMRGSVWKEVLLPALIDRRGWAVFMGTPNGPNHFRDMWYEALDKEDWVTLFLPVTTTKVIPADDLLVMKGIMDPEQYAQEMLCSFEASVRGAIYARQMETMQEENRIGDYPLDFTTATEMIFDLGWKDQTVMGAAQRRPGGILIGHAHGDNLRTIDHYIDYMEDYWQGDNANGTNARIGKPLKRGQIWLPHDARAKSLQTGKSIVEHFKRRGHRPKIGVELDVIDGIAAVRTTFPRFYFHAPDTKKLVLAAKTYHRKYDEELKRYSDEPVHDWSSDWMDMLRYLSISLNPGSTMKVHEKAKREIVVGPQGGLHYGFALNDIWDLGPNSSAGRRYG